MANLGSPSLPSAAPTPRRRAASRTRREAVQEAQATASQLAARSGVGLGTPLSIEEVPASGPAGPPFGVALEKAALSVPVESGRIAVQQQVRMVFELKR